MTPCRTGIHETDERLACLRYAEECCLDVRSITKCVVERIRHKESTEIDPTGDMSKAVATNIVSVPCSLIIVPNYSIVS